MIPGGPAASIPLDLLEGFAPFIVRTDKDLTVTWASSSVITRVPGAAGRSAADLVEPVEPAPSPVRFSPVRVREEAGRRMKLRLVAPGEKVLLTGRWLPAGDGFVLLASPEVQDLGALSSLSLSDLSGDDHLLDLLMARDELAASLADARRALDDLKDSQRSLEASRAMLQESNYRLRKEIEKRGRIEKALRGALEFQKKLLSTAATAIFTVDRGQRIRSVNDAFLKITGYSREEVVGRHCAILRGRGCREACDLFGGKIPRRVEGKRHTLVAKDGRRLEVLKNADVIRDEKGRVTAGVESFVDVTALTEACAAAEAVSRAKSEFLANMSHEIRTPMNGIIGMTELALETELRPDQREYLEMVKNSAESLLKILNDILDFSKIEAGKLDIDAVPFDLSGCLGRAMKLLGVKADGMGLELVLDVAPDVPEVIVGDPDRLGQVVVNLVGNALKFTEKGEIVVRVRRIEEDGEGALLDFSVSDTGIGISPEKQEAIFEEFVQADGSMTRRYGGTGLGLAISRRLVEMMGGRIRLKSRVGAGSVFSFTLPFKVESKEVLEEKRAGLAVLAGRTVLVVDDNSTNRMILEETFRSLGMRARSVPGGAEAIEALEKAAAEKRPFDLMVTDAMMPGMDGFALSREVRRVYGDSNPGIVMLTSALHAGVFERCRELGIERMLAKPVRRSELLDAAAAVIGRRTPAAARKEAPKGGSGSPPAARSLRVLLVEDNLVNRKVALRFLESRGHAVTTAANGREGLDALERMSFDVVLMDVQMPVMNGFETTAAIRERERRENRPPIPIVAMTAHAMKGDREACLAAGMDDYVAKPVRKEELLEAVERWYGAETESGPLSPGKTAAGRFRPRSRSGEIAGKEKAMTFDKNKALENTGGDEDFLRELAAVFLETCPGLFEKIREAACARDAGALERAAHSLKGGAANFHAQAVVLASLELEEIGREGRLDDAGEAVARLEAALGDLVSALEAFTREKAPQGS